jgi:hypothetical protein
MVTKNFLKVWIFHSMSVIVPVQMGPLIGRLKVTKMWSLKMCRRG